MYCGNGGVAGDSGRNLMQPATTADLRGDVNLTRLLWTGDDYTLCLSGSKVSGTGNCTPTPIAVVPTCSTASGLMTLSTTTSGAAIYYTISTLWPGGTYPVTTGSPGTPVTGALTYSAPFAVTNGQVVRAQAVLSGSTPSDVALCPVGSSPSFSAAATPVVTPNGGSYSGSVSLSSTTPGAIIYYTTDGSTPTNASSIYVRAFDVSPSVSNSVTLQAIAYAYGFALSSVQSATFTSSLPSAGTPTFSPTAGTYSSAQSVTISSSTSGSTIYYTTDGSTPTTSSAVYSSAIAVSATETVKAFAAASGYANSPVASAAYTINIPQAATPTLNPGTGTYTSAQSVTISSSTSGSTIYYTTDSSIPTHSSNVYSSAISISSTETIKAIASASGYSDSSIGSAVYTMDIPITQASDNFQRTNGALGSNWDCTGSSDLSIVSDAVENASMPNIETCRWIGAGSGGWTANQYAQVDWNNAGRGPALILRATGSYAAVTLTAYEVVFNSSNTINFNKFVNNSFSTIYTAYPVSIPSGTVTIKFAAVGSVLTVYANGTQVATYTDSSISGAGDLQIGLNSADWGIGVDAQTSWGATTRLK